MKDKELLEKLLVGEKRAFGKFYRLTKKRLENFVMTRVSSKKDAEEIIQDTYLSFLDSLPLFQGRSSLKTFLYSIGRHEVADYWRKIYAKRAIKTVPFVSQVYTEKLYSAAVTAEEIDRVYSKLLPDEVIILRLKYEEEMSVKEIARKLEISVSAAESRLFRARKSFQVAYADDKD